MPRIIRRRLHPEGSRLVKRQNHSSIYDATDEGSYESYDSDNENNKMLASKRGMWFCNINFLRRNFFRISLSVFLMVQIIIAFTDLVDNTNKANDNYNQFLDHHRKRRKRPKLVMGAVGKMSQSSDRPNKPSKLTILHSKKKVKSVESTPSHCKETRW